MVLLDLEEVEDDEKEVLRRNLPNSEAVEDPKFFKPAPPVPPPSRLPLPPLKVLLEDPPPKEGRDLLGRRVASPSSFCSSLGRRPPPGSELLRLPSEIDSAPFLQSVPRTSFEGFLP